jgi:hypothetical protein
MMDIFVLTSRRTRSLCSPVNTEVQLSVDMQTVSECDKDGDLGMLEDNNDSEENDIDEPTWDAVIENGKDSPVLQELPPGLSDEELFANMPQVDVLDKDIVRWSSFEEADVALRLYGQRQGFAFKINSTDYFPGSRLPRFRAYYCTQARSYQPKKVNSQEAQRNKRSQRISCPYRINIRRAKGENDVTISSCYLDHNHPTHPDTSRFYPQYRQLPLQVKEAISLYTRVANLLVRIQTLLAERQYSGILMRQDFHNHIQKVKRQGRNPNGDAARMVKHLLMEKEKDPGMFVEYDHDERNQLTRLVWMQREQVELYLRFCDVLVIDTTQRTNRFNMILMLIIGVDNHDRTRLLAQALTINERADTFQWIFEAITRNVGQHPLVVLTDADPALDSSLAEVFPSSTRLHCTFHLKLNISKNLACLRGDLDEFKMDFRTVRDAYNEAIFEYRWHHFMDKWRNRLEKTAKGIEYVENHLYGSRHYWSRASFGRVFTGGMESTQRCEGYNGIVKRVVNSKMTLEQVVHSLQNLLKEERLKCDFKDWNEQRVFADNGRTVLFPLVKVMERYLTDPIVDHEYAQVQWAMCEHVERLSSDDLEVSEERF